MGSAASPDRKHLLASRAEVRLSEEPGVLAWIHRHRHQLRALYGMPAEPRIQQLLDRARTAEAQIEEDLRRAEPTAGQSVGSDATPARNLRQHTLQPRRKAG